MMEGNSTLALVLCLTFAGVIGINALIIMWAKRKEPLSEFKLLGKLAETARNPLKSGDDQLAELSHLVAELESRTQSGEKRDQDENG